ncbi:GATA zinc finger domain-containing protein 10 [Fusarium oxysporum f. sp. albedinis]|nr:GATA zinc finger domain-containing protein 10 [Fusarium oxysporum f. sp. albedinis]
MALEFLASPLITDPYSVCPDETHYDQHFTSSIIRSIIKQHTDTVGRTFKPELDRPPYFPQKYASSCPAWLPRSSKRLPRTLKGRRPGNLECDWCFRVRTPQHFDVLQANTADFDPQDRLVSEPEVTPQDRLVPLRRFCIGCGVTTGLHAPSGCIITMLLKLPTTTKRKVVIIVAMGLSTRY